MPSSSTRYDIVTEALARAGRDVSLRPLAEKMLNRMLRSWAFEARYTALRKTGAPITIGAGQSTAATPADFGAGSDNLLFGDERIPMFEKSPDEFVQLGGFPVVGSTVSGRPRFYMVDQVANVFRFNCNTDQAYTFLPMYFMVPADIPTPDAAGDLQTIWFPDDEVAIQGLIAMIYQYTGDIREEKQDMMVREMRGKYRAGTIPLSGGVNKVLLGRTTFKRRGRF